jgi:hypothetical protein
MPPLAGSLVLMLLLAVPGGVRACPFCNAVRPTLAQERESSDAVALGELLERTGGRRVFRLHQVVKGEELLPSKEPLAIDSDADLKPGALALLLGVKEETATTGTAGGASPATEEGWKVPAQPGTSPAPAVSWSIVPVNELSWGYFVQSPPLRENAARRLRYFARYLEHEDAQVAEDAYLEFAHAPYHVVAEAAAALDQARLRAWVASDAVPSARKGFYAMALGMATLPADRQRNAELLGEQVRHPGIDQKAGLDGVLGGYLLLRGEEALEQIERQFLANPMSADGHVRHALTALRFYYEFGTEIPHDRQRQALRLLLDRPEFAAAVIADLARCEDWPSADRIASLFAAPRYDAPATRRAIVGFLLVCPGDAARKHLARLRSIDPKTVADVEQALEAPRTE